MLDLLDRTGESAQIYRRQGDQRVCIAAVERASGLRDSIPVGAMLSMEAGSAAQILLAWEDSERLHQGLRHAKFTAAKLAAVRKRGWSESVNEREEGVCSISAPIRNASGQVIAAISISGPSGRMGNSPGRRYAPLVMAAEHGLTGQPGYFFDMTSNGYLAVSLLPEPEVFRQGICAVLATVEALLA